MKERPLDITFFSRSDNTRARDWEKKITDHITRKHGNVRIVTKKPDVVIALGGDGTILEASRTYRKDKPIILGLNLGHVGFLASARRPQEFIPTIDRLLQNDYTIAKRMMVTARVFRKGRLIHELDCLNEVTAQGLMSAVKLTISIDGHPLQYVHGSGIIVSTPTGSTAYNLSAHGPIVTPDINCMIVTELLDHNIPTPSIIVKKNKTVHIEVTEVRKRGLLLIQKTGEPVDAVITVDDMEPISLHQGDQIDVSMSKHIIRFAEFEEGYFLTSLQKKFAFR